MKASLIHLTGQLDKEAGDTDPRGAKIIRRRGLRLGHDGHICLYGDRSAESIGYWFRPICASRTIGAAIREIRGYIAKRTPNIRTTFRLRNALASCGRGLEMKLALSFCTVAGCSISGRQIASWITRYPREFDLTQARLEEFRVSEIWERFPAFKPPPDTVGIFEPTAGWVDVNASLEFGLQQAKRLGAETRVHVPIERWERDRQQSGLTAEGTVMAERLIVTAGAWAGALLSDLRLPLRVLRKVLVWVDPLTPDLPAGALFPCLLFFLRQVPVWISQHRRKGREVCDSPGSLRA